MPSQGRILNLDVVRAIAILMVMSVHYLLFIGFYKVPVDGWTMRLQVMLRLFFIIGVPLFILLSGYFLGQRRPDKRHYLGLTKILGPYLLVAVVSLLFFAYAKGEPISLGVALGRIINFSAVEYGWYVQMYLGLYLLIPFLNYIYRNLETKALKQGLLLVLILMTVGTQLANSLYLGDLSWFSDPSVTRDTTHLLPQWWFKIYPITNYFTGAYLREYGRDFRLRNLWLTLAASIVVFTAQNIWLSGSGNPANTYLHQPEGFQAYLVAVMVFAIVINTDFSALGRVFSVPISKVARDSYFMYLIAPVTDAIFYHYFLPLFEHATERFKWYPLAITAIMVFNFVAAWVLARTYQVLTNALSRQTQNS